MVGSVAAKYRPYAPKDPVYGLGHTDEMAQREVVDRAARGGIDLNPKPIQTTDTKITGGSQDGAPVQPDGEVVGNEGSSFGRKQSAIQPAGTTMVLANSAPTPPRRDRDTSFDLG